MKKIFLEYPYINSLNTKVIQQHKIQDEFHMELEQTIFFPGTDNLKSDRGFINQLPILDVYEKNNKILHVLKEGVQGSVQLTLDWDLRLQRMQDHCCYFILNHYLKEFFNLPVVDYNIGEKCTISFPNEAGQDLAGMKNQLETLINDYILSSLPIKSYFEDSIRREGNKNYQVRKHFIKLTNLNNFPCQDALIHNSSEIRGFHIGKIVTEENQNHIEFLSGNRLFERWGRIIKEVENESNPNHRLVENFVKDNKRISDDNIRLKNYLINQLLKDCHNDNLQEIELDDIPLEVQDFMNLKPCKNVLVIQRKDHKLYFYTNSQNCLKEKYSDYSISILSNESHHIMGYLEKREKS